ncbi:uncharacterized protein LOC124673232 [Lolium rigidum]|uniref:uncharacterized protein LOC124673232 n=1 Tax=Lolium rigidum TaxID=89674 RepID=UPI001F5CD202|nr:uncharacterized protein LOC124673232 [Lolium rigidum]
MVLGKIAIVIGSGIVGTLVTGGDAGKLPDLRDVLSVSFKFMTKQDKKEGSSAASSPHTDQLLSQVNYLREQLRVLSDQKEMPHIIINGRPGAGAYGLTAIALGALGYLYIRWKGWKIADLMFVTKRGLADACNVVGKQLDQVSESVHASKKHLSGRIDRVDCNLDECHEIIEATGKEVTVIHGDLSAFQEEIQSVHLVVRTLETKLGRLAYTQDHTTRGIHELCEFTKRLDRSPKADTLKIAASTPRPAIESSEGLSRTVSLPSGSEPESPVAQSPRVDTAKVVRPSTAMSASGLSMLAGTTSIPKRAPVINRATSMKEGSSSSSGVVRNDVPRPPSPAALTKPVSSSSRFGFLRGFTG